MPSRSGSPTSTTAAGTSRCSRKTTYRQAPSEANASSVGLALDRYLALKVAYVDPGSRSVRLVGEDAQPQRFGTVPATASRAAARLRRQRRGRHRLLRPGRRGGEAVGRDRPPRRRDQDLPRDRAVGQLRRDRRLRQRRADRGVPRSPRSLRRRAGHPQVPQRPDRARGSLQREQPVQRAPSAPRARARATSASPWSRTERCSCSPNARSSSEAGSAGAERVASGYATNACFRRSARRRSARAVRCPGRRRRADDLTPAAVSATASVHVGAPHVDRRRTAPDRRHARPPRHVRVCATCATAHSGSVARRRDAPVDIVGMTTCFDDSRSGRTSTATGCRRTTACRRGGLRSGPVHVRHDATRRSGRDSRPAADGCSPFTVTAATAADASGRSCSRLTARAARSRSRRQLSARPVFPSHRRARS